MNNKALINILQKCLNSSISSSYYNEDIQPSKQMKYDGDKLAGKIEMLINMLKETEEEMV